ncbi:MAG: amidohydrolase family protein [Oscillospiraceae bacterium]|jgi:predicted TIM-barrel fold metal-dependent hydrolase|nr:amidohydrolase family protein [Oscillospiraceae bacterium]
MVIDFHTHAFPDALAPRALKALLESTNAIFPPVTDATVSGLTRYMDKCGVAVSVLLPVITKPTQLVKTNEWAASEASARIVPFGGIYPHTDDYKRDIDFVVSLGLKGLKFHAEYQDFVLDDPHMLRVYDYALSRGLILLHHAGYDPAYPPPYKSDPKRFAAVADAMRGGVIIAAHLGGRYGWDDAERDLAGRDVYFDTSMGFDAVPPEQFLRLVRAHGAERFLFATDSPWSAADEELARLRALPLPEADKEKIFSGNAKRILGM